MNKTKAKPKNWPPSLPYLDAPLHDKHLSESQKAYIGTKSSSSPCVPARLTLTPSPNVQIQPIRDTAHPANGQQGLFATRRLAPGSVVVAYLGRVHGGATSAQEEKQESDYDVWLDREADVAVDAAREGNEARFVNDYRGVRARANACLASAWCERWKQNCVVVRVVDGAGRDGIKKGEEIVVSYGKGFWEQRRT